MGILDVVAELRRELTLGHDSSSRSFVERAPTLALVGETLLEQTRMEIPGVASWLERQMLVLFDCDGTLFVGDDPLAQESMIEALNRITGAEVEPSAMDELDHEAHCARWLARELIRKHSLPKIDLSEWADLVGEIYLERVDGSDSVTGKSRAAAKTEGAVAVGDTSRDVRRAQDLGLRVVAVGFDGEPPAAEEEADGVIRTMPRLVETLRRIREGLS
jgi:phosphoglycolate phosphatase-like HAD superfamily hydrolase